MMQLVRAELQRFVYRRLTLAALLAAVAMSLVILGLQYTSLLPPTAAELATAQPQFEEAMTDWENNAAEWCVGQAPTCLTDTKPTLDWFMTRPFMTSDEAFQNAATYGGMFAFMLCALVCASLVAAEFTTGSMANHLTFAPNRTRVYLSKWWASLLVSALYSAALVAVMLAGTALIVTLAGAVGPTTNESVLALIRAGSYGVIGGLLGATLGFLLRSTAAALGALIGCWVLSPLLAVTLMDRGLSNLVAFLPDSHTKPLLLGRYDLFADGTLVITWVHSSLYWVAVIGSLSLVSLWSFRRRDLT